MNTNPYALHLQSGQDLITTYEATRAGFISMALEKNRQADPFITQAKTIRTLAEQAATPNDLLSIPKIQSALLTASGISDKAETYLEAKDKALAIQEFIRLYLEPAGKQFIDELVYRFLLIRGDTLGGMMRNIAGALAQRKLTKFLISALTLAKTPFRWLDTQSNLWQQQPEVMVELEHNVRGLSWQNGYENRMIIFNFKVPIVHKNVDLCLLESTPEQFKIKQLTKTLSETATRYIALGELKGGIDPAGADEHWKTAHSALDRIRRSFANLNQSPHLFFVAAAIEKSMANEIWQELESGKLSNAANLTSDRQTASIANWLCEL